MSIELAAGFGGVDPDELAGKFEDFEAALDDELDDAAQDIGARFEGAIKRNIQDNDQIDTGRMLNSIEFDVQEVGEKVIRVAAGTNLYYAEFQEALYPFVEPAFDDHGDWAVERVQEAIENARDEAFP